MFQQKIDAVVKQNNSLVCVGLDSDVNKIPEHLKDSPHPQLDFNKAIIDATFDLVCAYKPNSAFYEARGAAGVSDLKLTCDYLREVYPHIPIILDAKRGDIGSTNAGYVQYAFDYLGADAITLHPYLGSEAMKPFLERQDKGCIILCRTSNRGAGQFQDVAVDGEPLYMYVVKKVMSDWNANHNCFLVVGATYPKELARVRALVGDMTLLVPGLGAQGADVAQAVKAGLNSGAAGLILSSSRSILFASSARDFGPKAREATTKLKDQINVYRNG